MASVLLPHGKPKSWPTYVDRGFAVVDDSIYALHSGMQIADLIHPNSVTAASMHSLGQARSTLSAFRCVSTLSYFITGEIRKDSWSQVALKIITAVARFLSPVLWLHHTKQINLGSHAQGIGLASMISLAASASGTVIQNLHDWTDKKNRYNQLDNPDANDQRVVDKAQEAFASSILDVFAFPFENCMILSSDRIVCFIGAILGFITSLVRLLILSD